MNKIVIIGAGGHGKVVYEAIKLNSQFEVVGFVDSKTAVGTVIIDKKEVVMLQSDIHRLSTIAEYFVVAVGNNKIRKELFENLLVHLKPATVVHPTAIIGMDTSIGEGSVVLANAIVATRSIVGKNTIVNAGVIIDHECVVGNNVHLSIGTLVGSNSKISDQVSTSIGQIISTFSSIS